MVWQAIWSEGRAWRKPRVDGGAMLQGLTLDLEFVVPDRARRRLGDVPMRLWDGASGPGSATAIYLMPKGALRLIHQDFDIKTPDGFAEGRETLSLRYVASFHADEGLFEVNNRDRGFVHSEATGTVATLNLLDALPRADAFLGVAHVVGIASCALGSMERPGGIESGAIVATPEGPRPVDGLRAGDEILDADGEIHLLQRVEVEDRLCLGRAAPLRLRAPYFGLARDVIVTPGTRLLQTGPAVEYLCGSERVLAEANDLIGGNAICRDMRLAVRKMFHLSSETAMCMRVEGCALELPSDLRVDVPVLDRPAAQAVLSAYGRAA